MFCTDALADDISSKKKLEDIMHLAELCIEVLQQHEEHHAEVGRENSSWGVWRVFRVGWCFDISGLLLLRHHASS